MKEANTIYYSGQGYIYRCPECRKVDRMPWNTPPKEAECRFCHKSFNPVSVPNMDDGLYGVIQEINTLETGTPFGASREMLEKSNLVKAGKSVGIDVMKALDDLGTPRKDGDYFAPWRATQDQLKEMYKTPIGKEILEAAASIMMGKNTAESLINSDKRLPTEILEEARMMVLMKHNPGLKKEEKIAMLKKAGFSPSVDKRDGRVYVFFGSTYAPECDSWCYWD